MPALERILFRETTALGVRRWPAGRHKLERQPHAVQTRWGTVAGKTAFLGDGTVRFAPEYEACRRVAAEHGIPLQQVYDEARQAFEQVADGVQEAHQRTS